MITHFLPFYDHNPFWFDLGLAGLLLALHFLPKYYPALVGGAWDWNLQLRLPGHLWQVSGSPPSFTSSKTDYSWFVDFQLYNTIFGPLNSINRFWVFHTAPTPPPGGGRDYLSLSFTLELDLGRLVLAERYAYFGQAEVEGVQYTVLNIAQLVSLREPTELQALYQPIRYQLLQLFLEGRIPWPF